MEVRAPAGSIRAYITYITCITFITNSAGKKNPEL
jgi:hypothetical protein